MLIGKQLLEKVDELEKLGHDDQFILSACGYESFESFDHAYFEAITPPPELELIQRQQEVALKGITHKEELVREQREIERIKDDELPNLNERKDFLVKGKYLATVDRKLTGKYSDEEIAISCGYYEMKDNGEQVASVESYLEARAMAREQNEFVHIGFDCYETELDIFKGFLIIPDDEHGGTVYVPKRIVDQLNLRELQRVDREELDLEEELEGEELELEDFEEPMMAFYSCIWWILDDTLNPDIALGDKNIAAFYGLRYVDCHPASRFSG